MVDVGDDGDVSKLHQGFVALQKVGADLAHRGLSRQPGTGTAEMGVLSPENVET
jgi:hypothetical protein